MFEWELAKLLMESNLILGDLSKVIEKHLGIKESDLVTCCDCSNLYTLDMVVKLSKEEAEEFGEYRCLCCDDMRNTTDENRHTTKYYRNCLDEIENYQWE